MALEDTWTPHLPPCVPCPARRNTVHHAPRGATLCTTPRAAQHCAPFDLWVHGPAEASDHLPKWTGTFPGAPPREAFEVAREPYPGPCLNLPGTPCRGTLHGNLPGMPCRGTPHGDLPGTPCRGPCFTFPGTPCREPCLVPLPPEPSKGLTPLILATVIWPTRHEDLVPPEPGRRQ